MKAARVAISPDANGIAAVKHGLGEVKVTAHASADGAHRPVIATNVITPDEVEIITTPDATSVLIVSVD